MLQSVVGEYGDGYLKCGRKEGKIGPDSSVGIETGYGLDGPGIESR